MSFADSAPLRPDSRRPVEACGPPSFANAAGGEMTRVTAALLRRRPRDPVTGIRWAAATFSDRPVACRGTPAAVAGLRFERAVGRALAPLAAGWSADLHSGQWLRFRADNGLDWAQPDHFLVLRDRVLLLECKLSQTADAWHQLEQVYAPLLRWLYPAQPIVTIGVFRYLRETPERPLLRLAEAVDGALPFLLGERLSLHVHDPRRLA